MRFKELLLRLTGISTPVFVRRFLTGAIGDLSAGDASTPLGPPRASCSG
jgi:hypothetical protein